VVGEEIFASGLNFDVGLSAGAFDQTSFGRVDAGDAELNGDTRVSQREDRGRFARPALRGSTDKSRPGAHIFQERTEVIGGAETAGIDQDDEFSLKRGSIKVAKAFPGARVLRDGPSEIGVLEFLKLFERPNESLSEKSEVG